jgi:hypothetical protein
MIPPFQPLNSPAVHDVPRKVLDVRRCVGDAGLGQAALAVRRLRRKVLSTCGVRGSRVTDGQTDRQTDRRTTWTHSSAIRKALQGPYPLFSACSHAQIQRHPQSTRPRSCSAWEAPGTCLCMRKMMSSATSTIERKMGTTTSSAAFWIASNGTLHFTDRHTQT